MPACPLPLLLTASCCCVEPHQQLIRQPESVHVLSLQAAAPLASNPRRSQPLLSTTTHLCTVGCRPCMRLS
jgi:hypothetical protein